MGTEQCWACTESPPLEAGGTRLGLRPRLHYLWSCAIVLDLSSLLCAAGTVVPASGALGGLWIKCPEGCAVIQNMAGGQWQCRGKGWAGWEVGLTISMPFFFMRRQDLRYVRMRLRARSWNSGNCRLQDSMMAWIFSLGCLEMGTMRSRFSSTKRRTNICGRDRLWKGLVLAATPTPPVPCWRSR